MIYLAGAASLPLNSEELCNSAGTNPDGGLPFHRCTPRGPLALPGPESRYGSRSTRRVPKNPLALLPGTSLGVEQPSETKALAPSRWNS
jgi:hypothetical protein